MAVKSDLLREDAKSRSLKGVPIKDPLAAIVARVPN